MAESFAFADSIWGGSRAVDSIAAFRPAPLAVPSVAARFESFLSAPQHSPGRGEPLQNGFRFLQFT